MCSQVCESLGERYLVNIYWSELTGLIFLSVCMYAHVGSVGSRKELALAVVNSCAAPLSPSEPCECWGSGQTWGFEELPGTKLRDVTVVHRDLFSSSNSKLNTRAASQQFICFLLPNAATETFFLILHVIWRSKSINFSWALQMVRFIHLLIHLLPQ